MDSNRAPNPNQPMSGNTIFTAIGGLHWGTCSLIRSSYWMS